MDAIDSSNGPRSRAGHARAAKDLWRPFAWLAASATITLFCAWLGFVVQRAESVPPFLFPLIFPLALGVILGIVLTGVAAFSPMGSRWWLSLAAAGWGGLAVLTQEYLGYHAYQRQFEAIRDSHPLAAMIQTAEHPWRPAPWTEYLSAHIGRDPALWWSVSGLTVAGAALGNECGLRLLARKRSAQPEEVSAGTTGK